MDRFPGDARGALGGLAAQIDGDGAGFVQHPIFDRLSRGGSKRLRSARGVGRRDEEGLPGQLSALAAALVDTVLFTGDLQRDALTPAFLTALGGAKSGKLPAPSLRRMLHQLHIKHPKSHPAHGGTQGVLRGKCGSVRWATVGNFVNPDAFPFVDRSRRRKGAPLPLFSVVGR